MPISLVRTHWQGTSGGPGITQIAVGDATGSSLSGTQAQAAVNAMRAFWDGIKGYLPNELNLTVDPVVDEYNLADGTLIASHVAATPPALVGGSSTGVYGMAAGLKLNLNTNTINYGRRTRGAIYIVPTVTTAFSGTGTADPTAKTNIQSAASTMVTSFAAAGVNWYVWSRPRVLPSARAGFVTLVAGTDVNDKMAVLRGRRD